MRISDWSSDVCSSDLGAGPRAERIRKLADRRGSGFSIVGYIAMNDGAKVITEAIDRSAIYNLSDFVVRLGAREVVLALAERRNALTLRSEERRVGTECGSTCRSRW